MTSSGLSAVDAPGLDVDDAGFVAGSRHHRGIRPSGGAAVKRPATKNALVNFHEKVTDRLLKTAAADNSDRLLAKVRLADVIDLEHLTGRAKGYAMAAHLDFAMVNAETTAPRFAVELDGSHHWNDSVVRERDRLKDQLRELAGLPMLRIASDFTRREGRWTVLTYLVDAFYVAEAFYEAQARGSIPWDEPFHAVSFVVTGPDGGRAWNSLDARALEALRRHADAGRLPAGIPDVFMTAQRDEGAVLAHAFLAVAPGRYLVTRVMVRDFSFYGVTPSETADQLALVELGELAEQWLGGDAAACEARALLVAMAEVQANIDAGGFLGSAAGGGLAPGGPLPDSAVINVSLRP